MRKTLASIAAIVLVFSAAYAQTTDILIEIDTGRTQGMFTRSPVFQRAILAKLKNDYGVSRVFIMGHSMGTISSRWLAKNLGKEIDGSIHSSSMNGRNGFGYANSLLGFDYASIAAPQLHIHNENDSCQHTPYSMVKAYAGENLVTVHGGVEDGDPCGAGNLHSHQGNEEAVVRAIISWIKTGKVDRLIGG